MTAGVAGLAEPMRPRRATIWLTENRLQEGRKRFFCGIVRYPVAALPLVASADGLACDPDPAGTPVIGGMSQRRPAGARPSNLADAPSPAQSRHRSYAEDEQSTNLKATSC